MGANRNGIGSATRVLLCFFQLLHSLQAEVPPFALPFMRHLYQQAPPTVQECTFT